MPLLTSSTSGLGERMSSFHSLDTSSTTILTTGTSRRSDSSSTSSSTTSGLGEGMSSSFHSLDNSSIMLTRHYRHDEKQ